MAKVQTAIEPKSWIDFTMALQEFAKEVQGDVEMIGREQIRLMCRDAMTFTPPMPKGGGRGLSSAAHKAGMNKLGNDVRRIFVPADSPNKGMPVVLRQVINSVRANDQEGFRAIYDRKSTLSRVGNLSPIMRKIMQDTSYTRAFAKAKNYLSKANIFGQVRPLSGVTTDLRGIHDRYKGKVNGRWPKNAPIGGPQYFVDTTDMLNAYIAERQRKVGRVKSGWAAALLAVPKSVDRKGNEKNYGVYKAPWVDANVNTSQGIFSQSITKGRVSMTIQNMIGNINNVATEAKTENVVYGNRVKQMKAAVQARIDKAIARANRKKS